MVSGNNSIEINVSKSVQLIFKTDITTDLERKSTNILDRQGFCIGMDECMLSFSHFCSVFVSENIYRHEIKQPISIVLTHQPFFLLLFSAIK